MREPQGRVLARVDLAGEFALRQFQSSVQRTGSGWRGLTRRAATERTLGSSTAHSAFRLLVLPRLQPIRGRRS